jgi:hypothetical protein
MKPKEINPQKKPPIGGFFYVKARLRKFLYFKKNKSSLRKY